MCEATNQAADAAGLAYYLTTGLETVDATTDGIIASSVTLDDLPRLIPYLRALIECAYQITVQAVPLVKHATPERPARLGLHTTRVYACMYHARDLLDATSSFIDPIERELRAKADEE